MSILRTLAEIQGRLVETGAVKAVLDCGCRVKRESITPCAWHAADFRRELLAACETEAEPCDGCCDPA